MRMGAPLLLLLAALAVFGVVAYRVLTGGPPGPKTFAAAAVGVVLLVAALLARRRGAPNGPVVP